MIATAGVLADAFTALSLACGALVYTAISRRRAE